MPSQSSDFSLVSKVTFQCGIGDATTFHVSNIAGMWESRTVSWYTIRMATDLVVSLTSILGTYFIWDISETKNNRIASHFTKYF